MTKCIVHGCTNHSDAGTMVGPLCWPCDQMLRTGEANNGLNWVATQARNLDRLREMISALAKEAGA